MELADLDHEERIALVGLVAWIGESNREITDEESDSIAAIVDAFGADAYREIAAEADERFADEEALRAFLKTVRRQDAREIVYGTALDVAIGDAIQESESDLLDWLAREWSIEVRTTVPDEGE